MKKLNATIKTNWLLMLLFVVTAGYSQTVTVPGNCVVVVAGTGGTLGAGGKVGDGGMVSMPDPGGGGTFTFNPPSGATTITWNLKGDLSNSTTSPNNYGSPTQPPSGLTATIITYNKNYRSTSTEQYNPTYGRSKGQVRVGYDQTGCGKSMVFDIYKTFTTALPDIVGPACLKPNTQYTYSVDQIVSDNANDAIGFDSYYWSGLPSNIYPSSSFYNSADSSSITFTTGSTVTAFTLYCCYGRLNPNTGDGGVPTINASSPAHGSCVKTPILIAPTSPAYITAPPSCVATGVTNFTVVYPNPVTGQTYTWTAPNTGWTLSTSTAANTTLTVATNGGNNPGLLTLTITGNGCDPAIFDYQINRNFVAPLTVIPTGSTTTCINGTSTGNTFTISPNASSNSVVWYTSPASIPGVTLTGATTNTVTVNTSGAAAGSFTLLARSGAAACSGTSVSTVINVRPQTPAFTSTTPNCVLKNASVNTIAVDTSLGQPTTGYIWNLSGAPGWSITANPSSSNPTFQTGNTAGPVTISVYLPGTNGCNSTVVSKTINYVAVLTSFNPTSGFADQYVVTAACGVVTSWVVNGTTYTTSTGNITISGNNLSISGNGGTPITTVCANVSGVGSVCATSTGTHTLRQSGTLNEADGMIRNVIISPNPNRGNFNVKVLDFADRANATLTDFSGNEIQTFTLHKGDNKIEKEGLAAGTYFLVLTVDGKQDVRQIVIK